MAAAIGRCAVLVLLVGLAQAGPARAQSLPDSLVQQIRAGTGQVTVPGDSVVLPLVGTPTLPLVEARINGTGPYRLLIDLGSNVTLLRRNVVDASGCRVLADRTTSDIVRIREIRLGEARLENVTAGAYDSLDVDGVLGYNVLRHTPFTLDFPGRRLVLHHRGLPSPDGRSVLAYEVRGRMPYVPVSVGGDSLWMNLDTGASDRMTVPSNRQSALRWRTPPVPGRTVVNNQNGRTRVLEGRLADTVRVGPLEIPSPVVTVNPAVDDAWLGAAAMNRAVWTFDPAARRLQITVPAPRR